MEEKLQPVAANRSNNRKKKKNRKDSKVRKFFRGVLIAILAVILIGMLSVGGVAAYTLLYMNSKVSGDVLTDLNEYRQDQSQTTILYYYDEDGKAQEMARLHGEVNRVWVDYDDIPKNLKNAYIALEDKRFWEHDGVDWTSTIGIVLKGGFSRGGSTIDQQLIKNLTGENGRTFSRKFNEIIAALNLEKHFSKEKILETYLNTLYLDAGCYGVETASEYYFGKECKDLTLAECACLAAITKAPRAYDPIINPDNNEYRRNDECLYEMRQQGLITEEEYRAARDEKLNLVGNSSAIRSAKNTVESSDDIQSYYVDYVIQQLIEDFQTEYDMSASQAFRKVYYGGLRVYTCVDMRVQEIMEDVYVNRTGMGDNPDLQSAMVIVDYEGALVGIVGQAGEKTANRCLNIAANSPRQPGSSIKPLSVYAPGIDGNYITFSSMVENYGFEVNGSIWPYNYGGDPGKSGSYMTVQAALAPSYNTVPAQLVRSLGIDYCYEYLTEHFHMTHLTDIDKNLAPIAVGGMQYGVTCLEMAAAFATFGSGGTYYRPASYNYVTNSDGGKVWLTRDYEGEQAIEPGTADVMQELLRTAVTTSNGTARNYPVDGFETIAKTGTTTDNKDSWFVGGTPYYMCAVWYGYSQNPKQLTGIGGGITPSGRMFKTVMDKVHEGLDPDKEFEKSDESHGAYYCRASGMIANSGCSAGWGWYKDSNTPGYCTGCYVHDGIGNGKIINRETETEDETEEPTETEPAEPGEEPNEPNETPTENPGETPENPNTPEEPAETPTEAPGENNEPPEEPPEEPQENNNGGGGAAEEPEDDD